MFLLRDSLLSAKNKTFGKSNDCASAGLVKGRVRLAERPANLSVSKAAKGMLKISIKLHFSVRRRGAIETVTHCSLRVRLNMLSC